jgi:integrase
MAKSTRRPNGDAAPYWNEGRQRYELFVELPRGGDGKRRRKQVTGRTKTEARDRARAVRSELDQRGAVPDESATIAQMMAMFLDTLPGTVSDGTAEVYRRTSRLYIEPGLGRKRAAQLKPSDVERWLRDLTGENGRQLSPSTKRQARAVLRRALRWAERDDIVSRNAAALAEGVRGRPKEVQPLSIDQVRDLLAAVNGYRLEAAVVVMLTCGLRVGETLGLKWGDLDLDADPPTLTVRQQLQRRAATDTTPGRLVLTELKTAGSRRTMALPRVTVEAIRSHRRAQAEERLLLGAGKAGKNDLVFTTVTGTPVDARNFGRELKRLGTDAGIDGVHPHRLRHSAVAVLLDAGVPLEAVSETVGHSSIRTTKDVYGKLLDAGRSRVANAMDDAIGG